jgi:hypothetical protein
MKELASITFDPAQCRRELDQLQALLASKAELSERGDLQPLFKSCPQMTAFVGTCIPGIGPANRLAYEFEIFGDYSADLIIGNVDNKTFCAIELEDARPGNILQKGDRRTVKEWGRRLEHGFGQLVDWFFSFDDNKNSAGFTKHFGYGHIEFFGMLLIGRSADLDEHDRTRLRWRSDRVSINSHKVFCRTYDELFAALDEQWKLGSLMSKHSQGGDA